MQQHHLCRQQQRCRHYHHYQHGDLGYKPYVISEPEVVEYNMDEGSKFLVMASDGLWNEVRNEQVAEAVGGKGVWDSARNLVEEVARERGFLEDNTTVICVDLEEIGRRSRA